MVLTKEDRIELLARARQAKANKKLAETPAVVVEPPVEQPPPPKVKKSRKKNEIAPLPEPVHVIQEDDNDEEEEEVIEVPIPAPKKKATPNKFLKLPKIEPQKCCDEKVCHEQPLITDDKPQLVDNIVIPAKKQITKPRQPRASSRTLDILVEPKAIEEVMEEVKNNDMKYRPQQRQVQQPLPTPSAPISITYKDPPLRLFHY